MSKKKYQCLSLGLGLGKKKVFDLFFDSIFVDLNFKGKHSKPRELLHGGSNKITAVTKIIANLQ